MIIRKKFGLCQPPFPPKIFLNFSDIHLFFGGKGEAVTWQLVNYVARTSKLIFDCVFITTQPPQFLYTKMTQTNLPLPIIVLAM